MESSVPAIFGVLSMLVFFCAVFIVPLSICAVIVFFILRSLKGKARIFLDKHIVLSIFINFILALLLLILGLVIFNFATN